MSKIPIARFQKAKGLRLNMVLLALGQKFYSCFQAVKYLCLSMASLALGWNILLHIFKQQKTCV